MVSKLHSNQTVLRDLGFCIIWLFVLIVLGVSMILFGYVGLASVVFILTGCPICFIAYLTNRRLRSA